MEILERNAPCWCGSGKKYKKCHEAFDEKLKMYENKGVLIPSHEIIKTPSQIEKIRESAKINIAVLDYVAEHIQPGVTTQEIDDWVYKITTEAGGIPAPLDYEGYPKSVCTSINVLHRGCGNGETASGGCDQGVCGKRIGAGKALGISGRYEPGCL